MNKAGTRSKSLFKTAVVALVLAAFYGLQNSGLQTNLIISLVLFVLSLYALIASAMLFTEQALILGNALGLSKLAGGILIIAVGTSAPELFSSVAAAIEGEPQLVVANIYGTVVANTLLGIGFAALVATRPLSVHQDVFGTQMSVLLAAVLMSVVGIYGDGLIWYEGMVMLLMLIVYLVYVARSSKEEKQQERDKSGFSLLLITFALLLANLGGLFVSGDFIIDSVLSMANLLELSSTTLVTSVLAIGTSIPEIATAIVLARQNNADSLFGEIIGSNIFDLLGVFGIISLFTGLTMASDFLLFLSVSMIFTFLVAVVMINDKAIARVEGISLLCLFAFFLIRLAHTGQV